MAEAVTFGRDEIDELRAQHDAIARAGLLAISETSRERVLEEVTALIRDALGGDYSKIVLLQSDGALLLSAGQGWPPDFVGHLETPSGKDSQGRYTLRIRRPVVVDDLPTERRFEPNPAFIALSVVSGVSVVIEGAMRPYGILQVDARTPRAFSKDQVGFLQSAANIIGGFLDRETREQERELFFSAGAHELRGPLTSVLGFAGRLWRNLPEGGVVDESSGQALALIEESARRMERSISILSELLQVSVRRSVPQDEVSLTTLLPNLLEELQPAFPDVIFELEMPKTEVVVSGEYQSARIALRNLLENAAKYSNREPRVRVVMGDGASGPLVRVADTCRGLAGNELNRMFEAYYRGETPRSSRGLGLGLYLTARICSTFGWQINVDNRPGEGCSFCLRFPAVLNT